MGPFSVTGQPNAMGGREVGGLANMLAAHMELADPDHRRIVSDFWAAPRIAETPGLKAVDLFRAVGDGRIKALWIMATNPVVSLPDADAVRACARRLSRSSSSRTWSPTPTRLRFAHVLLPSLAWGEKDGTVTNSERRISRQRTFLPPPGDARPDWWQIAEVARRMGFGEAFAWQHPAEIFAEYAALTAADNDGSRDLDIGAYGTISPAAYDRLMPFQWPQPNGAALRETRFFANGGFFTADRRARFVATPYRAPAQKTCARYPLVLNTGRLRDQWHTMTRTAKSARLMAHAPEPTVEVSPADAAVRGLVTGGLAEIESFTGTVLMRVAVTDRQRPGSVFAPMHWTSATASRARIDTLVGAATDPVSGQPELKHTGVAVRPFEALWHAFAVTLEQPAPGLADYVAIARLQSGYRCELAGKTEPDDWDAFARALPGLSEDGLETLAYRDETAGRHRLAIFSGERLVGALFVARGPLGIARTWIGDQLGRAVLPEDRLRLLAGRPGAAVRDRGPIVCACLDVGRNEIAAAITAGGARSVAAVGLAVKAGTNCGSCRSDIQRIIDDAALEKAG